ncbi:peptidase S58 family protein [Halobacillus litoralis]|uniref:Peptidase S58 family protein n=1 Tax=Halobacillus litoralis TaxID=45668 RepID=A0A845DYY0_9BACI|nr:P1 family peptidase [Halobacillus litoralis]MYL48545.1 peptidase S58 family protein [Halobacillus litoralis]
MKEIDITEIEEFDFGQKESEDHHTGCTVILCQAGATAGVDVRGGAPGTRETDALKSENLVQQIHGLFLSGGSAFGLEVGSGVMRFLEEEGIGFDVGVTRVPVVPGAILFDLRENDQAMRPDATMGYKAAASAFKHSYLKQGNYGAGAGATVGKGKGPSFSMKGGLGHYAIQIGDVKVGAVVAVNSFGDVINPETGQIIAGLQKDGKFLNTEEMLMNEIMEGRTNRFRGNTTIGAVVTNAKVDKPAANKLAGMTHDGLSRTIRPSHTFVDGDTMFFAGAGNIFCDYNSLGVMAVRAVEKAVQQAVAHAESTKSFLSAKDLQ